jgi:hypothetical protein
VKHEHERVRLYLEQVAALCCEVSAQPCAAAHVLSRRRAGAENGRGAER